MNLKSIVTVLSPFMDRAHYSNMQPLPAPPCAYMLALIVMVMDTAFSHCTQ